MIPASRYIYPTFEAVTTTQFKDNILPLKNKLYRFALSYLANEADAKDVVQDVMIKSWQDIKDLSAIRNVEAWCMTVTRNRSLDQLRKKGRNYLQVADQEHLTSQEPNPLQRTTNMESYQVIHAVIAKLPENQKDVVQLRDIEGHSYKEIAEMLNLDINHVKVLLHRGRAAIKKELQPIYGNGKYSQ
jgi:RNA polymerase sigma-70 factor (ECF subfamily)